jgi:signal transduction histidine kinase
MDERADQLIHHAVDGSQRMQNLINDLLLFSRVGTRGKDFAPAELDAVLARALANVSESARESNAEITRDPLPTLVCDAAQIEQVLQNFLANALKFRRPRNPSHSERSSGERSSGEPSGGEPSGGERSSGEMLAPRIHIGARHEAATREWIISVRDNGPGIEPQYFERIWVMFQRLHTRVEYPGTGIGLAVCKKIIERHGGRVGVDSQPDPNQPDQGSTFWFSLPAPPDNAMPEHSEQQSPEQVLA